jgi:hypothetical protein
MPQMLPVRGVGDVGVITDVSPSSLQPNAYSRAKNVRFDEGKISRAPVFRKINDSLGITPRFTYAIPASTSSSYSSIVFVSPTYQIREHLNGAVVSRQGSISTTSSSDTRFTGTSLADMTYLNRSDRVPVYMQNGGSQFANLPNWDSTWRAESLRAYGDFLIALNTSESGIGYSSRVRWSNLALANSVPDSWDATDTTKSAGFNDLIEMTTPIIDGAALGTNFIIYSRDQVWLMEFTGGTFIFNFRKVFSDVGIINQNCAVEVEGKHFVFGDNDIYMHDTHTKQSIVDERVKQYIFTGLNTAKTDRCFVQANPDLEEVYFCYISGDDMAEYTSGDRCNRAAVYNYKNNTWSFLDLPNISSGTHGSVESTATYATASGAYDEFGGSYYSQEAGFDTHALFVGESNTTDGITAHKLYGLDMPDTGSLLSYPLDTQANKGPYLERSGIDLDELTEITRYKIINKIYPQVETASSNKQFNFSFGAADLQASAPTYENQVTFDASTDHKIDSRAAGRYLSYKMTVPDNKNFAFIGFDIELTLTGRR